MKKILTAGLAVAFAFSISVGAMAAAPKAPVSGEISIGYMPAKADFSDVMTSGGVVTTEGGNINQNFLPTISGVINIAKPWSAIFEYDMSGSKTEDTMKVKSTQYQLGAKYDFQQGLYTTLSYGEYKFQATDVVPTDSLTVKFNGFRIGGGISKDFAKTPYSAGMDIGFGIANKAKMSVAAGSISPKATRMDFKVKGSYKIGTTGIKADLGYNYISMKQKASTAPNGDILETTLKVKGPFIGATYAF
jgi:hypothetical protein